MNTLRIWSPPCLFFFSKAFTRTTAKASYLLSKIYQTNVTWTVFHQANSMCTREANSKVILSPPTFSLSLSDKGERILKVSLFSLRKGVVILMKIYMLKTSVSSLLYMLCTVVGCKFGWFSLLQTGSIYYLTGYPLFISSFPSPSFLRRMACGTSSSSYPWLENPLVQALC